MAEADFCAACISPAISAAGFSHFQTFGDDWLSERTSILQTLTGQDIDLTAVPAAQAT
jgi:hypothetical protein